MDQAIPAYGALTDVGRVRQRNEDFLLAQPPLFIVADGMGGHAAGDVASRTAVAAIAQALGRDIRADEGALQRAVEDANAAVLGATEAHPELTGMGTTCTAVIVDGSAIVVGHVGDSRAYRLSGEGLEQLTADHTLVGELVAEGLLDDASAIRHPARHVITRALGANAAVMVDVFTRPVATGDRLLLCTDGLSGQVSDAEIARVLAEEADPHTAAARLIAMANQAGGEDNVTAIVIDPSRLGALPPRAPDGPADPARVG